MKKNFLWAAAMGAALLAASAQATTVYQVSTLPGMATSSGSVDGTGTNAQFFKPRGAALDGSGNLYVTDTDNYTIRKITPGGVVTTFAGSAGIVGTTDGTGTLARLTFPTGVAVDGGGNVYVCDNETIRKITSDGVVTTLAGSPGVWGFADGTNSAARFNNPSGVAADGSGNVYGGGVRP